MDGNLCERAMGRDDAYEKQCASESLSETAGWCKSQLSHFEKRVGFAASTRHKIFSALTLFLTLIYSIRPRGKRGILFRVKVTREREIRRVLTTFNKGTILLLYDFSRYFALLSAFPAKYLSEQM